MQRYRRTAMDSTFLSFVAHPLAEGHCPAEVCVFCGQQQQRDGMLGKIKKTEQVYLISKVDSVGGYCIHTSHLWVPQPLFLGKFRRTVSRSVPGAVPTGWSSLQLGLRSKKPTTNPIMLLMSHEQPFYLSHSKNAGSSEACEFKEKDRG